MDINHGYDVYINIDIHDYPYFLLDISYILSILVFNNPPEVLNWRMESQLSIFESCLIRGKQKGVEMHHVKHLRK
jgi:hypothetical protein